MMIISDIIRMIEVGHYWPEKLFDMFSTSTSGGVSFFTEYIDLITVLLGMQLIFEQRVQQYVIVSSIKFVDIVNCLRISNM